MLTVNCVGEPGCPNPIKVRARKLCNVHYIRLQRAGLLEPLEAVDLFGLRIAKGDFCWEWTGRRNKDGYGKYASKLAHRVSYERAYGPIPNGMTVDHLCRNRGCVNPGHLRLLPPSQNFSDTLYGRRERCGRGHRYTDATLRIRLRDGRKIRCCRACDRERQAESKARRRKL